MNCILYNVSCIFAIGLTAMPVDVLFPRPANIPVHLVGVLQFGFHRSKLQILEIVSMSCCSIVDSFFVFHGTPNEGETIISVKYVIYKLILITNGHLLDLQKHPMYNALIFRG